MISFVVEYAAPRVSRGVVVHEKRLERFSAESAVAAFRAVKEFLAGGAVQCGDVFYRRTKISLRRFYPGEIV